MIYQKISIITILVLVAGSGLLSNAYAENHYLDGIRVEGLDNYGTLITSGQSMPLGTFIDDSKEDFTETIWVTDVTFTKHSKLVVHSNEVTLLTNPDVPNVYVTFQDGTIISGNDKWDYVLNHPRKEIEYVGSDMTSYGIKIGSPDSILLLDKPATIHLIDMPSKFKISTLDDMNTQIIIPSCGGTYEKPDKPVYPNKCTMSKEKNTKFVTYDFPTTASFVIEIPAVDDTTLQEDTKPPVSTNSNSEEKKKKNGGGCSDCTPPTLGLNKDFKRIVDNGFSYNDNTVQVEKWHTPFPLINATVGEMNQVEILVYENNGVQNMKMVQFGLGAEYISQPLHELEVLIEVPLFYNHNDSTINVDELTIRDKNNLIDHDTVSASAKVTQCTDDAITENCTKVTLQYSYREATINHVMVVDVTDKKRNNQAFYFNDGVQVLGESMNPAPIVVIPNKQTSQQTENLTLTLTRTDKINHIWIDENGIEYLKVSENRFDRITPAEPYKCVDPPLNEVNVPTRQNCHFRELLDNMWNY